MMLHWTSGKFGYSLYEGDNVKKVSESFKRNTWRGNHERTVENIVVPNLEGRLRSKTISFYILKMVKEGSLGVWDLSVVGDNKTPRGKVKELVNEKECAWIRVLEGSLVWVPEGAEESEKERYLQAKLENYEGETKRIISNIDQLDIQLNQSI
eukprot:TRINITY_DN17206_c0_g1_i6.p1 TRINITY_DN17206_c0_g1~~TRINITY_DN17206_c0_g1_i6.p1  ORF type:complete len:153 (+),score=30.94 TRINITY_DN17206_c0_g1_i6:29-487(+)